jgi:membrane-associated phospholipid phosphatase
MLQLSIQGSVIFQEIIQLDRKILFFVNREMVFPYLDQFALFMRNAKMHIPLYIFFLYVAFKKYGNKKALWWLLGATLLIGFSDLLSSQLIKPFVGRLRPCRDPDIAGQIRLLASYCGANGSFTSSHAVNHFAFATFTIATLGNGNKQYRWLYLWAALIAYSQVYVGVHFPSDVLAGAILGIVLGWIGARFSLKPLTLRPQV